MKRWFRYWVQRPEPLRMGAIWDTHDSSRPPRSEERMYARITLEERYGIAEPRRLKFSMRVIAVELGWTPSTVSREIRRNRKNGGYCLAHTAGEKTRARRRRSRRAVRVSRQYLSRRTSLAKVTQHDCDRIAALNAGPRKNWDSRRRRSAMCKPGGRGRQRSRCCMDSRSIRFVTLGPVTANAVGVLGQRLVVQEGLSVPCGERRRYSVAVALQAP